MAYNLPMTFDPNLIEQEKMDPAAERYVATLAARPPFTTTLLIEGQKPVPALADIWGYIDDALRWFPGDVDTGYFQLRISSSHNRLLPGLTADQHPSAAILAFDSSSGVMRRCLVADTKANPDLHFMAVPSGLMIVCQPAVPLQHNLLDTNPLELYAHGNIYGERGQDRFLSGNQDYKTLTETSIRPEVLEARSDKYAEKTFAALERAAKDAESVAEDDVVEGVEAAEAIEVDHPKTPHAAPHSESAATHTGYQIKSAAPTASHPAAKPGFVAKAIAALVAKVTQKSSPHAEIHAGVAHKDGVLHRAEHTSTAHSETAPHATNQHGALPHLESHIEHTATHNAETHLNAHTEPHASHQPENHAEHSVSETHADTQHHETAHAEAHADHSPSETHAASHDATAEHNAEAHAVEAAHHADHATAEPHNTPHTAEAQHHETAHAEPHVEHSSSETHAAPHETGAGHLDHQAEHATTEPHHAPHGVEASHSAVTHAEHLTAETHAEAHPAVETHHAPDSAHPDNHAATTPHQEAVHIENDAVHIQAHAPEAHHTPDTMHEPRHAEHVAETAHSTATPHSAEETPHNVPDHRSPHSYAPEEIKHVFEQDARHETASIAHSVPHQTAAELDQLFHKNADRETVASPNLSAQQAPVKKMETVVPAERVAAVSPLVQTEQKTVVVENGVKFVYRTPDTPDAAPHARPDAAAKPEAPPAEVKAHHPDLARKLIEIMTDIPS